MDRGPLVDCSPWSCKELDTTEHIPHNIKCTILTMSCVHFHVLCRFTMLWNCQQHPVLEPFMSYKTEICAY